MIEYLPFALVIGFAIAFMLMFAWLWEITIEAKQLLQQELDALRQENEVFVVEVIIPFTGHTHYKVVVAKDKEEAEGIVREIFRDNPIGGDMSDCIILVSEMIDRTKKGIVEEKE